ncbi:MAG: hypothetical protein ACKPKO_53290, partial [Candidatus Fonsibacter sp.]
MFGQRNIIFNNNNDKWDYTTDIGYIYIYNTHEKCGLDVVLNIPQISSAFQRPMFGYPTDFEHDPETNTYRYLEGQGWPDTDVFTEIVTEPTSKFLHLNCSGSFEIPPQSQHYHITLTHTNDLGKGYNFEGAKLREW